MKLLCRKSKVYNWFESQHITFLGMFLFSFSESFGLHCVYFTEKLCRKILSNTESLSLIEKPTNHVSRNVIFSFSESFGLFWVYVSGKFVENGLCNRIGILE